MNIFNFLFFRKRFNLSTSDVLNNIRLDDIKVVIVSFIVLTLARFLLTQTKPNLILGIDGLFYRFIKKYKIVREGKEEKWCESLWYTIWHTFSLTISSIILFNDIGTSRNPKWVRGHFLKPTGLWFLYEQLDSIGTKSWPNIEISPLFQYFYLISVGLWLSSLIFSFTEVRRTDTLVLQIHHILTAILIYVSHITRVHRIGIIVIFLHDFADILLYFTKVLYYSKSVPKPLIVFMYGTFGVTHFITRFVLMCRYIYMPLYSRLSQKKGDFVYVILTQTPVNLLNKITLVTITIMNTYWLGLIIKMVAFVKSI